MAINLDNLFNKPKAKGINIDKYFPSVTKPVETVAQPSQRVTPLAVQERTIAKGITKPIQPTIPLPEAARRIIPQAPPQPKFGIFGAELSEQDKINIRTRGQFPDIAITPETVGVAQVRQAIKTTPAIGQFQKKELEDLSRGTTPQRFLSGLQKTILPVKESPQALLERETGLKADIQPSKARTAGEIGGTVAQFVGTTAATGGLVGAKVAATGLKLAKGGKIAQTASKLLGTKVGAEIAKDVIISTPINTNINNRRANELGLTGSDKAQYMVSQGIKDLIIDMGANAGISLIGKGFKALKGTKQLDEVAETISKEMDIPVNQVEDAIVNANSVDEVVENLDNINDAEEGFLKWVTNEYGGTDDISESMLDTLKKKYDTKVKLDKHIEVNTVTDIPKGYQKAYYRATTPGETRRIATGEKQWDDNLFVADNVKSTRGYGGKVEKILLKEDSKILKETDDIYDKIIGDKEYDTLMEEYTFALNKAKELGYDVIEFSNQSDVGTIIINENKILRDYVPEQLTKQSNMAQAETPKLPTVSKVGEVVTPIAKIDTPLVGKSRAKFEQTVAANDLAGAELKQRIKDSPEILATTTNEARRTAAEKIIKENPEAAINLVKTGEKFDSDVESFIGEQLVVKLQKEGRYDDAIEIISALNKKFRTAGQQVQAASIWSKLTPQGMVKWAGKTLDDAGQKLTPQLAKQIDEAMQVVNKLDDETMIKNLVDKVKGKVNKKTLTKVLEGESTQRLKDLNIAKIMGTVTDEIPKSLGQKISSFQAISHLLNAKTMIRNIFGNTTFGLIETLNKLPSSGFDRIIAKRTGKRTVSASAGVPKSMVAFKEGVTRGKRSLQEILLDVNILDQGKYDLFRGRTFKAPVLSDLEQAMSIGLKVPDEFAKGTTKTLSLIDQMRLRLGKSVDDMELDELLEKATKEELEIAEQEALYATFQDNSVPARLFRNIKDTLNIVGIGKNGNGLGKDFGLGDLVIKYTTVPGNLISRGIEYSPLGYLKAIHNMGVAGGKFNQRAAAQSFGRATTGIGLVSMGTWLANKSLIVSEGESKSLDARALDRAEGLGQYKINVTAVGRMIEGGDPRPQKGDTLSSYNWNEPLGTALAIGATLNKNLEKGEVDFADITSQTVEEMLDLPTMMIIQKMMYEGMDDSDNKALRVMSLPLTESASGFIPGPIRQAAQLVDPVLRDTRGDTPLETVQKKVRSSIPGLSKSLEPRISPLGEEIKRDVGPVKTFISPGIITKFTPSIITPKLKEISSITGETNFFPSRKAPSTITDNKQKITLTPKETTKYQKTAGTKAGEDMQKLLKNVNIDEISEAKARALAKQLEDIKRNSRDFAKKELLRDRRK